MGAEYVAGVLAGITLAILALIWRHRSYPRTWLHGQKAAGEDEAAHAEAEQVAVLREQVLEIAREQGINLPASAVSSNGILWSNGERATYIPDFVAYKAAVRADPTRTWNRNPPVPVSRWDRARLQTWLDEHTD